MPEDGIVCLDNGMYKIWFARNYRTHVANTLLLDNALATMGAGLPSAMMAAILYPDRRVMAVCGDGGFMMNTQEMETAVRLKLNLVVLVLQDYAYGMIRWKQAVDDFPDFGLTFGNPTSSNMPRAYGARGTRVETADDLVPMLKPPSSGGVHLVGRADQLQREHSRARRRIAQQGAGVCWHGVMAMIKVIRAYDRSPLAELPADGADALEAELSAARRVFLDRDGWLEPHQRIDILRKLAVLLEGRLSTSPS